MGSLAARRCKRGTTLGAAAAMVLLAVALTPQSVLAQTASGPGAARTASGDQVSSGDDALDNAVAAVVVAALVEQLGTPSIAVSLESLNVAITSVRDRRVSGQGRLRMDEQGGWIGFGFSTVYDTTFHSAGYPEITIGGIATGEREVPNDSRLVGQLEERVASELDAQFPDAARLQLDDISTVEGGQRLLRINARGIADFGRSGSTPVEIVGLYDRTTDAWQRVNYVLGAAAL